ncbi:uncharacterized protein LOC128554875 [Mercenaria mercenaria]|uniref:uncharacterized protein LOC128554875 n=1 Tax=Mercenaria mercenaria TaxID=6596 RepID=UPI00234E7958|nr:uncharacterized protein LOC128554875 [Mercenaria mercenaria]
MPNIRIGEDITRRIMFTDNFDLGGSFEWEDEEFDIEGEEELYRDLGNNTKRVYGAKASSPHWLRQSSVGQDALPTHGEGTWACPPLLTKPGTYLGTSGHSGHVLSGAPVYQLVGTTPTTPPSGMSQIRAPPIGSTETTSPGYPPSMAPPVPAWRSPPANPTYKGPKTSFPVPWQLLSSMTSVGGPPGTTQNAWCLSPVTAVHGGLRSDTAPPGYPPQQPTAQSAGDPPHTTPAH